MSTTLEMTVEPALEPTRLRSDPPRRWTTEEFLRLVELDLVGKRDYLWDGVILEAMSKKRPHSHVESRLLHLLPARFPPGRWYLTIDAPLRLADGYLPQPDFMVLNGGDEVYATRDLFPADVFLLIEVSYATYADDAGVTLAAYARAGIPLYWIVNIHQRRVEVYTQPDPTRGNYAVRADYGTGMMVPIEAGPIAVDDLFRHLPA